MSNIQTQEAAPALTATRWECQCDSGGYIRTDDAEEAAAWVADGRSVTAWAQVNASHYDLAALVKSKDEVLRAMSIGLQMGAIKAADVEMMYSTGSRRVPFKTLVDSALALSLPAAPVSGGDTGEKP